MAGRCHRVRVVVGLMLAAAVVAGCESTPLPFGGNSNSGRFIGNESLSRITPGETDSEWVLAVMGRPKRVEQLSDGVAEIWKYEYERVRSNVNSGNAYLVNSRDNRADTARYIYIQLAGGVVTDWWRD